MHLIINLVFFTSFQFINLSNLALWVNNRCKWITVIFLNLCDNLLYYMICFCLLSLVFVSLLLFISLSWSCLHISNTHLVSLPTLWIYYGLPPKLFLTLPFFFLLLVPIIAQLPVNKQSNTTPIYSVVELIIYLWGGGGGGE